MMMMMNVMHVMHDDNDDACDDDVDDECQALGHRRVLGSQHVCDNAMSELNKRLPAPQLGNHPTMLA
eukprot:2426643-Amphidinium_carterae.1